MYFVIYCNYWEEYAIQSIFKHYFAMEYFLYLIINILISTNFLGKKILCPETEDSSRDNYNNDNIIF